MLEKYKEFMSAFIKFKSISTAQQYKDDCKNTALFLKSELEKHGFKADIVEGFGNPLVVAEFNFDPNAKTVLIYGHYDVQPAELQEGWSSEPFEFTENQGRFVARGIVDNKGQIGVHIVTVFDLIEKNKLKYNVRTICS